MLKHLKEALSQFKVSGTDFVRLVVCIILMAVLFYPDWGNLKIVCVVAGFFVAVAAISHFARRLLLPYFEMNTAIKMATQTPLGAAIVVASVVYLLSVMLQVGGAFFR